MQHWKTISLTNGRAWTESHSPVSRFQPHYSSKEVQLWRGLQNADGLARGELAGKVGAGATLQTPAELQGSGERSHLCPCLSSCEAALHPHLSHCHTERPHPISQVTAKAFMHIGEEQMHTDHPMRASHHRKIYCCRRGKLIACSRGNKNSSRLLKWWRVWS